MRWKTGRPPETRRTDDASRYAYGPALDQPTSERRRRIVYASRCRLCRGRARWPLPAVSVTKVYGMLRQYLVREKKRSMDRIPT
eukprot:3149235-Prymnesium_polylepis.2